MPGAVFVATAVPTYAIAAHLQGESTARPDLAHTRIQSPTPAQLVRNVPPALRRPQGVRLAPTPSHTVATPASLRRPPGQLKQP